MNFNGEVVAITMIRSIY